MARIARSGGVAYLFAALLLTSQAGAADDPVVVVLEEGQTLRDLAEQHLGDPDLWMEILRANDLAVSDVRPGIEIAIPVGQIVRADQALQSSLDLIQKATLEGARLFAPDEIAQAIWLRDAAVAHRKAGAWDEAARVAGDAGAAAEKALASALAQRDAAAEALLSDRQGWVEGQRAEDVVWSARDRNSVLVEEEKVRTLSRSTAQITFRDDSRLRLNPNSQAVIQRMRVDPLSRAEEAKVTLVEGDLYALLSGKSARKSFGLEIPNVETDIEFDQLLGAPRQHRLEVRELRRARAPGRGRGRERHARQERRHGRARRPGAKREAGRAARPGALRTRRRRGRRTGPTSNCAGAASATRPATGSRSPSIPPSAR